LATIASRVFSGCEQAEQSRDRKPEPADAELAGANGRINGNPLKCHSYKIANESLGCQYLKDERQLGMFDYLSRRLAICGNPDDCLAQALAAKAAGAKQLMLTVSLAADPVHTVELFGEHVLPEL
jgi:hypothetical protein